MPQITPAPESFVRSESTCCLVQADHEKKIVTLTGSLMQVCTPASLDGAFRISLAGHMLDSGQFMMTVSGEPTAETEGFIRAAIKARNRFKEFAVNNV